MSSSPRITESSVRTRTMASLQRTMSRTQTAQDQISSGKQLRRPSDSPTGTVTALQLRSEVRANQKYSANADDAVGRLGAVQDTLQDSIGLISKVRELTLAGVSAGGGSTPEANKARAAEVEQIKGTLIQYANTKYLDRPVFGGATPEFTAYDSSGGLRRRIQRRNAPIDRPERQSAGRRTRPGGLRSGDHNGLEWQ